MSNPETAAVLVERVGHVMVITINRPEARNACNQAVWLAGGEALEEAERDPEVRAIVVTGAGDLAFCAGADLKAIARGEAIVPEDPVKADWGFAGIASHAISKPIIAAVNGTALGGGTELALSCDLVIAVEDAQFGLPEVKRGLIAGAGGAFRLPRQVPQKVALQMMFTGNPVSARRALELGMVNEVTARGDLMAKAMELAETIAANAPLAVQATKRIALGIEDGTIARESGDWDKTKRESEANRTSQDAKEGPRAFAEKRAPVWQAR